MKSSTLPTPQRRFAHLWLPRLSTDRLRPGRPPTAAPLVVVAAQKNALRLTAVDERAAAEGLQAGMTLADARARTPALDVAEADPTADLALLLRALEACRRFTPSLALHAPDAIDLDVTGCAGLFGGERRLLQAALQRLGRLGLKARGALADAPGLAWAAARFGGGGVVEAGTRAAVLAPLSVEALRLDPAGVRVLRGLGFKTIGALLDLPRAALARRLGEDALDRLDEALGRRASPLELSLETQPLRAERRLFEPVTEAEQVLQVTADLARDLARTLDGQGLGGRRFALELFRVDGALKRLEVAASRPLRHPEQVCALFAERLAGLDEGLQADFGFDQLRLSALRTASLPAAPSDLLDVAAAPDAAEALADRLAARSAASPRRIACLDVHTPEDAETRLPLDAAAPPAPDAAARFLGAPLRPIRLFRPPQPIAVAAAEIPDGPPARFTWRRITRTVVRAEGPERLEPEWARHPETALVRDYYRLEDEAGRRYWVFRQGRYDADPEPPLVHVPLPEAVKPVRPPPKAPPSLESFDPARVRNTRVEDATRPRPHLRLVPDTSETPPEPVAPPPAPPPCPAWFLHGLFG